MRALVEQAHEARKHRVAGVAYRQFLRDHPDERAAMEVWEAAPLVNEIEPKQG